MATKERQVVEARADSAASPETVWSLLEDATSWSDWGPFDEAVYERRGTPPPHGVGAVRRFKVRRLWSREKVLVFEPPSQLSYSYEGSLPVKDYRADVTLSVYGPRTRITWHSEFTPKLPFTRKLMRRLITRVLEDVSTRLARAAEAMEESHEEVERVQQPHDLP
jgi:hypothetical protein